MKRGYFITGTDTSAGKTWATASLMHAFKQLGQTVVAMKPVASGCVWRDGHWQNDDALVLRQQASLPSPYGLVNPYAYEMPVSPHLAGKDNPVDMDTVLACYGQLTPQADVLLVEGAGGWYAPINAHQDICDLAKALQLPVILVVGIRLGCINHAKLSHQAITASGLACAGWIAVCNDPHMRLPDENIATLKTAITAPLIGVLPYQKVADFPALALCLTGVAGL